MHLFRRCRLSACDLRLLALGLMTADHLWFTGVLENPWFTCLGRLAFPIFAFQIAEGSVHTRDFRRYCGRLLLFAALSEIPFDLMTAGTVFAPGHQNVMLTLLLGLLAIHFTDLCLGAESSAERFRAVCGLAVCLLCADVTHPDYGLLGVVTVLGFRLTRELPRHRLWQAVFLIALHGFAGGPVMPVVLGPVHLAVPVQAFAVLALGPIWLYSGEKGARGRWLQAVSYWYYPAHMLILALI